MATKVTFVDTTLRDGQMSLWALGMRTGMMLPTLEYMDEAGFEGMEFFVPSVQIQKMIRELGENPWDWLRLGAERVGRTPLRLTGGYRSALTKIPEAAGKLLVQKVIDYGVTTTRISDPWNDFSYLREEVEFLRQKGMKSVVNLIYAISPRHSDKYFVQRARDAAALDPYRICFKDVGGLLTPDRARKLIPKIKKVVGTVPLEFHGHCNNGFGPVNVLEAVEEGIHCVHTAVPPLANGSSNPSVFAAVQNLRARGYECAVDESSLRHVEEHLFNVARRENLPIGRPLEYDERQYKHQVPGGMISNLRHQLKTVGMEHRLEETLEESGRVRAEFGYPIMVTPLAQFVGSQAAINVITGERYKQVTDEVIHYALGHWGSEAKDVMDTEVRALILDRGRARELSIWEKWEPSLEELRRKYGANLSDEELILRVYGGESALDIARSAKEPTAYSSGCCDFVGFLRELVSSGNRRFISLSTGDLSISLKVSTLTEDCGGARER